MKVKKIVLGAGTDIETILYMCPNCNKGHQVEKGIPECDICKVKLEWEESEVSKCQEQ